MVSFTVCLKKLADLQLVCRLCCCLLLCWPLLGQTAEIEIANPQLSAADDGFVLSADFAFELGPRLEEAVTKGVSLHFVADFELTRPRWYWLDEKLVSRSQTWRLSYNTLTRQYRLANGGGLHQSFATLGEGLQMLSRLRNPQDFEQIIVARRNGQPVRTYLAALRLRLDISQLPRPFQISALGNRDWNLASDWRLWQLNLPPAPAAWSDGR